MKIFNLSSQNPIDMHPASTYEYEKKIEQPPLVYLVLVRTGKMLITDLGSRL